MNDDEFNNDDTVMMMCKTASLQGYACRGPFVCSCFVQSVRCTPQTFFCVQYLSSCVWYMLSYFTYTFNMRLRRAIRCKTYEDFDSIYSVFVS